MGDTLKVIGSGVVAILLLAIPAMWVVAITNDWHPMLIIIIGMLLIIDVGFLASLIEDEGDV